MSHFSSLLILNIVGFQEPPSSSDLLDLAWKSPLSNSLVVPIHFFYSVRTFKGPVSSQALNSLLQGQVHGPTTAPITISVSTCMVLMNSTVMIPVCVFINV